MQVLKVIQNNVTVSLDFHRDYCAQKNTQLDAMMKMFAVPYVILTLY